MDAILLAWSLGLWCLMVLCAVLNGIFRQSILLPRIGKHAGHIVSSVILSLAVLLVSFAFFSLSSVDYSDLDLWFVGILWVVLTTGFEFGFGHFVMKRSWSMLLEDYNLLKGRVWSLVLLVTFLSPYLMGSIASSG